MSDTLVLMRHGKAQRPAEGMLDMERKLTAAGCRSLEATLSDSLGLFPKGRKSVEVWSSPAARAEQTARIMLKALKRRGIDVSSDIFLVDSLWTQDADSLMNSVRACEADIVVVVGHNPFIEDLTLRLCGSSIDYATGGFAAVSLAMETNADDGASYPGRLLWFAQGPISQRWKTLVQMEGIVSQSADNVQQRLDAFVQEPDDIETMHKFRVSIRTLRSLIAFIEPWQDASQNKYAQKELKSIVGLTSRLRELDVMSEQAAAMNGASVEFIAFCESLAEGERGKVLQELTSKSVRKRLRGVVAELSDVKWRKRIDKAGLSEEDVRARFDGLAEELRRDVESLDVTDAEATHDVRKSAKRVRYDAERFKSLLGEDAVGIAKNMTAHQDNLGAICDARVNIDIINGLAEQAVSAPVAWDLALLRAQNETFLYTTLRNAR